MTKPGINLQDSFLNQMRKDNASILLVLLDGSRLAGQVRGFDNFTIIVQSGNDQHLVYKHAVAQITHQRDAFRPGPGPSRDFHSAPQESGPAPAPRPAPRPAAPPQQSPATEAANAQTAAKPKSQAVSAPAPAPQQTAPVQDAPAPSPRSRRADPPAKPASSGEKSKFNSIDLSDVKFDQ